MSDYPQSEILYDFLPEWTITLGSRSVKSARVPHRCSIGNHEIPVGASYSRVTHLVWPGKVVQTNSCGAYCWMGEDDASA